MSQITEPMEILRMSDAAQSINAGDWTAYVALRVARDRLLKPYWVEACETNQFSSYRRMVDASNRVLREALWNYLGRVRRPYSLTEHRVFTQQCVRDLASANQQRRESEEPFFARIADLYRQIGRTEELAESVRPAVRPLYAPTIKGSV